MIEVEKFKIKITIFGWFSIGFHIAFGLIIPLLLVIGGFALLPDEYDQYFSEIFATNMLILNAILYTIIFVFYQIQKEATLVRFIMSIVCLGLIIYFYFVGSSIYSLYLPNVSFAQFGIVIEDLVSINFNYFGLAIITIILQSLITIRDYLTISYANQTKTK